ncbi:MAG TPA: pyridoxamine 5'-phosphate oxidase family protein [Anaerolineales bacterium]
MNPLTPSEVVQNLLNQKNIWLATIRPDGRPHLVPIWYIWRQEKIYLCIEPSSVKAFNISRNSYVSLALEDGSNPVICEGVAREITLPWPVEITAAFKSKYDWDIPTETRYTQLLEVTPDKWLHW